MGGILIDTSEKPSWWKRNGEPLVRWVSVFGAIASLFGAITSWYEARQGRIDEHWPMLEIVEAMKNGTTLLVKNSGRSAAMKIHNNQWCDVGQPLLNTAGPSGFKVDFSIPIGVMKSSDVPSGGTFSTSTFIPWQGLYKDFDAHYTDNSWI